MRVLIRFCLSAASMVAVVTAFSAVPALAEERAGWALTASTDPSSIAPGGTGTVVINVVNIGAASSTGVVTVTDTLPRGVTAKEAGDFLVLGGDGTLLTTDHEDWNCAGNGPGDAVKGASTVTCTNNPATMPAIAGGGGNINSSGDRPYRDAQIGIVVGAPGVEGAISEPNRVAIAGGGALGSASTQDPIVVSSTPGAFRFTNWDVWLSNANGTIDTQAGSHPYAATVSLNLANEDNLEQAGSYPVGGNAREIDVNFPPGFAGNPNVSPQCTSAELDQENCPRSSQIGLVSVTVVLGGLFRAPVYNMVPPAGVADQIGFTIQDIPTLINTGVRTGGDYGLASHTLNIPEKAVTAAVLTLWGVPGESNHDIWRGSYKTGGCSPHDVETGVCEAPSQTVGKGLKPFLTLPTSCGAPQPFTISANTWEHPGTWTRPLTVLSHDSNHTPTGFTGCEHLSFGPTVTTSPDTTNADTPAGLTVDVTPPVGGLEDQEGLGTSDIQNTTVTLPQGVVINPGQAAGLAACGPAEDGLTTEAEGAEGKENDGAASCPNASKVGTVTIRSPLIESSAEKQFEGSIYVLRSNPPELKLLFAASADGVNLKLVGVVHLNEQTGQLTTKLEGTPQLPFTDAKFSFSGGAQAALDTPTQCGTYGTGEGFFADFTPWADPFVSDVFPTAEFAVTHGPGGGPCPSNPLPFSPSLTAGATTDQAGGFTDFSLLLQRGDGQQRISGLQFKAPLGLTGELSKVPLCTNAQAEANACPEASKIGHTVVESGPGPYPLVVPEPGQPPAPIYLTESYGGAPFGLSIVVPLHVGPFVLPTQRVRAKIEINPITTQLTITTNELPQIVAGVPTDLREIDAVIERPEFMVNPTNCNPQEFSGTATGTPPPGGGGAGAGAPISSHFQVGSCRSLEFKPKFAVSTLGRTSKANGAGLTAKVTYPAAAQGTQANITRVKVDLPKQLPSRLTTLQKACTNKQFELNPADCPKESKIGYATVHTPLLPVPVSGPAIFVSHGGEAFPSLTMVLQGDNVTVDLVGTTFISKAGVTSTTFKTVPDVPFSSFELTLGQGKFSALAADLPVKDHGSFCGQSLAMPTEFLGQNGLKINESTKISVSGCKKAKKAKKASKKTKTKKGSRKARKK